MIALLTVLAFGLSVVQVEPQDKSRVPDDSIEVTVVGCLKGRALTTVSRRDIDVQRGVNVGERTFRLSGKRDVMNEVQRRNRQLVEVVGIVRRAALDDDGVRSGRVSISGGSPVSGTGQVTSGVENVPVMDVSSIRLRAASCSAE